MLLKLFERNKTKVVFKVTNKEMVYLSFKLLVVSCWAVIITVFNSGNGNCDIHGNISVQLQSNAQELIK